MSLSQKIGMRLSTSVPALLVSILIAAPYAAARSHATPPPADYIAVTSHLGLEGTQVKEMFVQRSGDKTYLYLEQPSQHEFAVVDVTNPAKPRLLDEASLPEFAGETVTLPAQDSVLAIAVAPESDSSGAASATTVAAANLPTESVQLIDLGNPEHPRVLKTLNGVTSVATDDGRKLVFVANSEGLWIFSHHRDVPLPQCTTDDEAAPVPSCQ